MVTFSVSMMCTNYLHLYDELRDLDPLVDGYHIDIMDGSFVPNFAMNFDMIKSIQSVVSKPLDVHMMVNHPERYLTILSTLNVHGVVLHPETLSNPLPEVIKSCRELGLSVGVAISPGFEIATILPHLSLLDKVTVMMVNPGFAGQSLILDQLRVVEQLSSIENYSFILELDGSTNEMTASAYAKSGATQFIFGSSLFQSDDLAMRFRQMKQLFE